jgi:hypothetical protein
MTTMSPRSIVLAAMLALSVGVASTPPASAQVTDCTGQPDGTSCNDGNACDGTDTCKAGGCVGSMIVDDGVQVARLAPATAVISWSPAPGATGSDVVRGLVSALPMSPTDAGETLLVRNTISTSVQDATVPQPGAAFWYLVRGRTSCGGGPWGFETRNGTSTERQPREGCVVNTNASPRYFDLELALGNPQPTVTDIGTCLVWEKKSRPGETAIHDAGVEGTWDTVNGAWIASVNAEAFAGKTDWRVPSLAELRSIVESGHGSPTINPIFGLCQVNIYWTSEKDPLDPQKACGVDFGGGFNSLVPTGFNFPFVRAVRGGP